MEVSPPKTLIWSTQGTADYCDPWISCTTKCSMYYRVSVAPGNSLWRKLGLYFWSVLVDRCVYQIWHCLYKVRDSAKWQSRES